MHGAFSSEHGAEKEICPSFEFSLFPSRDPARVLCSGTKTMIGAWLMTLAKDANDRSPMRTASHVARGGSGGEAPRGHLPPSERWPGREVPKVLYCCTSAAF